MKNIRNDDPLGSEYLILESLSCFACNLVILMKKSETTFMDIVFKKRDAKRIKKIYFELMGKYLNWFELPFHL
jgi:hypothetical protein